MLPSSSTQSRWFSGGLAALCIGTPPAMAQITEDWSRHFRLGAQVALNLKADFKIGGQFGVSGSNPGSVGTRGQERIFDDGYVRVDDTGNAGGYTTEWGYENPAQYDAANNRLLMHSTESFATQDNEITRDGGPQVGLDLAYGTELLLWGRTLIGWDFGFSYLPINIEDNRPLQATLSRRQYWFSTDGITFFPDAPYQGGTGGTGPAIDDLAQDGGLEAPISGIIRGTRELDLTLYNFRLGPTFYWDLGRRWSLQSSLGVAMGLITGDYAFNERATTSNGGTALNSGSIGTTDVVFGGYANTTLLWHTSQRADLFVGAQFMTLGDSQVREEQGGRAARLEMGRGIYLSAGVNWAF
ncbi:MAG: hypothetical protein JNN07_28260 [Verrucomicrobiales bacterium]|nr:hypothetical protein [Verrucomicrobiales bacterium]